MTLVDADTGEVVARLSAEEARFTGLIHPAAERYPVMGGVELEELASDIAENGQLEPIWLDVDGTLLDGRNRLAACRLADVQPFFAVYDGGDVEAFIVSKNEHRRHLTQKQQRELRQARIAALREKGMSTRQIADELGVDQSTVVRTIELVHDAPARSEPEQPIELMHDASVRSGGPEKVAGKDGKKRPAKRRVWTPEDATRFLAEYGQARGAEAKQALRDKWGITDLASAAWALRKRGFAAELAPASKAEKVERIRQLASTSMTAAQIGKDVGLTERVVRQYANEAGITIIAEKVLGRGPRLDATKVVGGIVTRVAFDIRNDSALAAVDLADVDPALIDEWVDSLSESIRSLTTLRNRLKELTRE